MSDTEEEVEIPEDSEDFWRLFNLAWWHRILERLIDKED